MSDNKNKIDNTTNNSKPEKKPRFQREGEDAAYLFRGFHEKTIDPEDCKLFIKEHKDWVNKYGERNVRHNFERTRDRYTAWSKSWEGESNKFLSLCGIVAAEVSDDLDPEFVKNRGYFPPSGGGVPVPEDPQEKKEKAEENKKLTAKLITESGINNPPLRPTKKKKIASFDGSTQDQTKAAPSSSEKATNPMTEMTDHDLINAVQDMNLKQNSKTFSSHGFRAKIVTLKKAFIDPVYDQGDESETRSAVLVMVHLPSGCDGNDVHMEILEGGLKMCIEVPYPPGVFSAEYNLGPRLSKMHPVMRSMLNDDLTEEKDEAAKVGDATKIDQALLDLPFPVEPRFRCLNSFEIKRDPIQIILTDSGAQIVLGLAFKIPKFNSPSGKRKKSRQVTGPANMKVPVPGLSNYVQYNTQPNPYDRHPNPYGCQPNHYGQPIQQQPLPSTQQYSSHQFLPQYFSNPFHQQHPNAQYQQPPLQYNQMAHFQHQQMNQYLQPSKLYPPSHKNNSVPEAMSVASSNIASKRTSRSSQGISVQVGNNSGGVPSTVTGGGGPSSPRVRDRPGSTEPPSGRINVVRPRKTYNEQASSTRKKVSQRTGLMVETVKTKGSSSYDEYTVNEDAENGDQFHSPTNITPENEQEPNDGESVNDYDSDDYDGEILIN